MAQPITIRYTEEQDGEYLRKWLKQPETLHWFPLSSEIEIDDAVRVWMVSALNKAGLTALIDDVPCGMITLYQNIYKKIAHQSLLAVIVDGESRGKGIGTLMMEHILRVAKEELNIELIHLEVYEANPAKRLYERMGFEQYGIDPDFIKENGVYLAKICMQKWI